MGKDLDTATLRGWTLVETHQFGSEQKCTPHPSPLPRWGRGRGEGEIRDIGKRITAFVFIGRMGGSALSGRLRTLYSFIAP